MLKPIPKILSTSILKIYYTIYSKIYKKDLTKLAQLFNCDKWGEHFYTVHYQRHFEELRKENIALLEIGIGGFKHKEKGGESLRMWKSYFQNAKIFGVDIYDKKHHDEKRIKTFQGDQTDPEILDKLIQEADGFDIIIDDGSHINTHVLYSFKYLFPFLKSGGIYVIEDTQTSYWPRYGGSDIEYNSKKTTIGFFKSLVDGLNYEEYRIKKYLPTYYDENIIEMHFYHNLIFIKKGENREGSNMLGKRYK